jgi:hypothetical protein
MDEQKVAGIVIVSILTAGEINTKWINLAKRSPGLSARTSLGKHKIGS